MSSARTLFRAVHGRLPAPVRRLRMRLVPGSAGSWGWEARSEANAELYWESTDRPHRAPLLEHLASFSGAATFLELGSSAGPNLRLAAERFPEARLSGFDIDAMAIAYGQARFDELHPGRVTLRAGRIGALVAGLPDRSEDVVFSAYALAYLSPRELRKVLRDALRVARAGLVLAEPQAVAGYPAGLTKDTPEWRHDYARVLEDLGLDRAAMLIDHADPDSDFATLVARLAPDAR